MQRDTVDIPEAKIQNLRLFVKIRNSYAAVAPERRSSRGLLGLHVVSRNSAHTPEKAYGDTWSANDMIAVRTYGAALVTTFLVFVALDAAWLMLVSAPLFFSLLGEILRPEPMIGAAIAFYIIYVGGLFSLAVMPAIADRSITAALVKGALLGLTAYATFDLTNLAIIKGWTVALAAFDMAWGVIVSALASAAGYIASVRAQVAMSAETPAR